jgi:Domain of unknown function DUF29
MATQLVRNAPERAPPRHDDHYAWLLAQLDLLRARRLDEVDLQGLIAELEDVALSERSAVLNNARVVIEHLLKLQYSPARDPRNKWRASVREHRNRLQLDLDKSLKAELANALPRIYRLARETAIDAMRDYGETEAAAQPAANCPYGLEEILSTSWWPESMHGADTDAPPARARRRTIKSR